MRGLTMNNKYSLKAAEDHQETVKRDVHQVKLSSFPPPLRGGVLTLNWGISQRQGKGKIKTASSQATPGMIKTR